MGVGRSGVGVQINALWQELQRQITKKSQEKKLIPLAGVDLKTFVRPSSRQLASSARLS